MSLRNAWNRHLRSFIVDTETLSNNMKFLSQKCWITFHNLTIYTYTRTAHYWSDYTKLWHYYPTQPFTKFLRGFYRTFAMGVACRQGTCKCSTFWDQSFSRTCRYFPGLCTTNIPDPAQYCNHIIWVSFYCLTNTHPFYIITILNTRQRKTLCRVVRCSNK